MFEGGWGHGAEGGTFFVRDGSLDVQGVRAAIAEARRDGQRVALLGATFAFVHLFDAPGDGPMALPAGSVVMSTGGCLRRSRVLEPEASRGGLRGGFSVAREGSVQAHVCIAVSRRGVEGRQAAGCAGR